MHNAKWVDALINALPTTSNEELNASRGAYVKWRAILSTQKLETTQRFVDNERALDALQKEIDSRSARAERKTR